MPQWVGAPVQCNNRCGFIKIIKPTLIGGFFVLLCICRWRGTCFHQVSSEDRLFGCDLFTRERLMGVLYLFVPISMVIAGILVWAAFWAIRNNQYEDLEGPAHRILLDDDDPRIPNQPEEASRMESSSSSADQLAQKAK
jgi:cbb3-type cytochrome oxidase maturation protein